MGSAFAQIVELVVETAAGLLGAAFLLRAYMNWLGMPGRNPVAQFVFALTDWAVRPLRSVVPAAGRVDLASLICAYLTALAALLIVLLARGVVIDGSWVTVLLAALVKAMRWGIFSLILTTIVYAVIGWVNPHAPMAPAFAMLVRPLLAPIQRILPLVRGLDLSPLVLILLLQIVLILLDHAGLPA